MFQSGSSVVHWRQGTTQRLQGTLRALVIVAEREQDNVRTKYSSWIQIFEEDSTDMVFFSTELYNSQSD